MKKTAKAPKAETTKTKKNAPATTPTNGVPASIAITTVAAPPEMLFPKVPAGFKDPGRAVMSRYCKPTDVQRADALDLADELQSATSYYADFGAQAPDPTAIATALTIAAGWDGVFDAFSTYATYALAMRAAAWDAALRPVNRLHGRYEAATTDDPALTKSYAKLEAFFGAREESAARGAATRKKNTSSKKAAAAKASAASVTSSTQH